MVLNPTIPLTNTDRAIAQEFSSQQSRPQRREQIYQNTLSVLAVHHYCQWMNIPTDLEQSESWDPVLQGLSNIADLCLSDIGQVECRFVASNATVVEIPAETWGERIGYIAVQFDSSFHQAQLVGFVEQVQDETIPLRQLQPLKNFLDIVYKLEQQSLKQTQSSSQVTHLSQWIQGITDQTWKTVETIEALLYSPSLEFGFSFRQNMATQQENSETGNPKFERGKLLNLEKNNAEIALFVGLAPIDPSEMDIFVDLYPAQGSIHLPDELQLMVLDHSGRAVMQAEAGEREKLLYRFSSEVGESFSIKVVLGEVSVTEAFLV
ncbi:MAG: DUF1822 family protein [Microcoleaceae cyanobacterium]